MKTKDAKALPRIVSPAEWQASRESLLKKEKAATETLDALAAERRRLPMIRIDKDEDTPAVQMVWMYVRAGSGRVRM